VPDERKLDKNTTAFAPMCYGIHVYIYVVNKVNKKLSGYMRRVGRVSSTDISLNPTHANTPFNPVFLNFDAH
jgi:hypothetical protein